MSADFNGVIQPHPDDVKVKSEPVDATPGVIDVERLDEFGGICNMDTIKPHRQNAICPDLPPLCPIPAPLEPVSLMDVLQVAGVAFVSGLAIGLCFTWAYSNKVVA